MPVPDFQTIMLPLLQFLADGQERSTRELTDHIAQHFKLSEQEIHETVPTGQPRIVNRIGWAKTDLKHAGLLTYPRVGYTKITERGVEVVRSKPERVGRQFLLQYPEYASFLNRRRETTENAIETAGGKTEQPDPDRLTPQDHIDFGYRQLRNDLATELLDKVKRCPPDFFEKLVIDLLLGMGYGGSREDAGSVVGRSGDGGIDGVIKEDRLGLDAIYIQAKRWEGTVGRPEVQRFAGALQGQRARKGIMLTTSEFSKDATTYAATIESRIVLIGGTQLAELMIDHGIGVSKVAAYEICRLDSDYFELP